MPIYSHWDEMKHFTSPVSSPRPQSHEQDLFIVHEKQRQSRELGGDEVEVGEGSRVPALAPLHTRLPAVVSTGKHMAAWNVYIYKYIYIFIHFVWGDMFYMPVLPVIGQTFTLGLSEASGEQERASVLAGRLQGEAGQW